MEGSVGKEAAWRSFLQGGRVKEARQGLHDHLLMPNTEDHFDCLSGLFILIVFNMGVDLGASLGLRRAHSENDIQENKNQPFVNAITEIAMLAGMKPPLPISLSHHPIRRHHHSLSANNKAADSEDQGEEGAKLRGSDVLQALQRATSTRHIKKNNKGTRSRGSFASPSPSLSSSTVKLNPDHIDDRPLKIQSDWADRLDRLEVLLQDLQRLQN
ncbi:hypothetical protein QJS10_CPA10g00697 [Acorus calamus]|uniref:Uncharacterized protein n=1 Tax=Acorus calamus TaxID=4465 RepID=A0AAV9E3U2_ACOCL|nr:hypothetical protein QJS10_CPA10g00697 [Acorus calamus]